MQNGITETRQAAVSDNPLIGHVTRPVEECMVSFRVNLSSSTQHYVAAGYDLMEIKAQCAHGQWLKVLDELGISSSAAENHMKIARELAPDSPLAALPYSKALALMALPAGERESFAREIGAEDKSAKEIARLIREKQSLERELERKTRDASEWQKYYNDEHSRASQLRLDLDKARNAKPQVIEKEVVPEDYCELKEGVETLAEQAREAEQAAIEAQGRARELEREVAQLKAEAQDRESDATADSAGRFLEAVNTFLAAVQVLPHRPEYLADEDDRHTYRLFTGMVASWAQNMMAAIDQADHVPGEAVVV